MMKKFITIKTPKFLVSSGYPLNSNRGQAAISAVLFFVSVMLAISFGFSSLALGEQKNSRTTISGKKSYYVSEAGQEDVVYRYLNAKQVDSQEVVSFGDHSATTTSIVVLSSRVVTSRGDVLNNIRNVQTKLSAGEGATFNYGLQSGLGGIHLKNSSSIQGNVFSNGPVTGDNSNIIKGDVISADVAGLIDNIHATGTAYAHTISNSLVEGDAYYDLLSNTTVLGTEYPDSPDQATSSLPITDSQIEIWKADALAGGIITSPCPYEIDSNTTLGPVKIECDLQIDGSPTVTLAGSIWVEGDIKIKNSPTIQVSASLNGETIPVIADDSSQPQTRGVISLENTATFEGAGENSYIVFISQNTSAEESGSNTAIEIQNSVTGDVLVYAGHGKIDLKNSVNVKEVTAYRIEAQNTAEVIYETGLASLLFTSGPSGGYTLVDWEEVE